jgi:hypothetical protein
MAESRRLKPQSRSEFAREAYGEIAALQADGLRDPAEIAEALNRNGFPDAHGRQWTAAAVLLFLASPAAEKAARALPKK